MGVGDGDGDWGPGEFCLGLGGFCLGLGGFCLGLGGFCLGLGGFCRGGLAAGLGCTSLVTQLVNQGDRATTVLVRQHWQTQGTAGKVH